MSNKMYFRISRLPDISLSKYASLSDTGVDGILERHSSFLRQWHRIASLGQISMHLFINYDPLKESGEKLDIGFLIDSNETQGEYLEIVQRAFSASPLSEFFDFQRADDNIQEIENRSFDTISMLSKNERFLYPINRENSPPFFYVVPLWEMQDESRLYNMLKMMQAFNVKCEYRLDIYADNIADTMHERFRKPLHWLRNNCRPDTYVNILGEQQDQDNDPAASDALKQYEDFLEKIDTSPAFYAHITMLCDDEKIGKILLESAASEAIKEGYDKITTYKGNYNGLSYYKHLNRGVHHSNAPDTLNLLPITYTLQELDAFFRFPTLYDGETVEIPKETAPKLSSKEGIFLGNDVNGYDVYLPLNMLKKHMFVCGVPGAGKTNTMLRIATSLWKEHQIPFLVLEPAKKEYRELSLFDIDELIVFSPNANTKFPLRINPFEFPIGLTLSEHISVLDAVFEGAFPLYSPTPFLLDKSIENIYVMKGWNSSDINDGTKPYPTLSELYKQFESELKKTSYDGEIRGNIQSALEMRIGSLLRREMADIFDVSSSSYSPEEWMKRPIVIELEALGEGPANFTTLLLCSLIRETLRVKANEDKEKEIRHVIMIEEAHNLIASTAQTPAGTDADPKISATAFIVKMLAEVRALREGIIIADQLPTAMAPEVIKNTNIKLVHRLTSQDDRGLVGSTMSANEIQMEQLATFSPGQSLIVYEGLLKPFEMQIEELPSHGKETPNDNELFNILKKQSGFREYLVSDAQFYSMYIAQIIKDFAKFIEFKIENLHNLNFKLMNKEQSQTTVYNIHIEWATVAQKYNHIIRFISDIPRKCKLYDAPDLHSWNQQLHGMYKCYTNTFDTVVNQIKSLNLEND